MQITDFTDAPHRDLVAALYSAVDNLDAVAIGRLVTRDVRFRLGNFDELRGKPALIDANNAFFGTISAMPTQSMTSGPKARRSIAPGRFTIRVRTTANSPYLLQRG